MTPQSIRSPVICAGLYSSGSTWAYNVVRALLQVAGQDSAEPVRLASFFAEDIGAREDALLQASSAAAIKCHRPSPAMLALIRLARLPVVLTVREPRDCVASLMQRFGLSFRVALDMVVASAGAAVSMRVLPQVLPLRYEDGVIGGAGTIRAVADHLDLAPDAVSLEEIARSLSADSVRAHIAALEAAGGFGHAAPAVAVEPETEWHPGHLGDGRVGKHRELLSAEQEAAVLQATRAYCEAYGYPGDAAGLTSPTTLRFAPDEPGVFFLGPGFAQPDDFAGVGWGAWTQAEQAEIVLPLRPAAAQGVQLTLAGLPAPAFWQPGPARCLVRVNGLPALELEPPLPPGSPVHLGYRTMLPGGQVGVLRIGFEFAGLRSPAACGVNQDERLLGLALTRVGLAFD